MSKLGAIIGHIVNINHSDAIAPGKNCGMVRKTQETIVGSEIDSSRSELTAGYIVFFQNWRVLIRIVRPGDILVISAFLHKSSETES